MRPKTVYVVIAYKWGDRKNHSYTLGVFDKKYAAQKCADSHTLYRGGKYSCAVEECVLNHFDDEDDFHTKEIYKTKSMMG